MLDTWKFICPKCGEKNSDLAMVCVSYATDIVEFKLTKNTIECAKIREEGDSSDWGFDHYECPNCNKKFSERQIIAGVKKMAEDSLARRSSRDTRKEVSVNGSRKDQGSAAQGFYP
jgi:Zn finger protein HypA/HybF involved in hydrogenase expression